MAEFYLDDLESTPEARVVLTHVDPSREGDAGLDRLRQWTSYVVDDLALSASAEYAAPFADLAASVRERANKVQAGAGGVISLLQERGWWPKDDAAAQTALNTSLGSYAQSILHWNSSERPTFQVSMHFVTWRNEHVGTKGVTRRATELASMPLPGISSATDGHTMTRPAGYNTSENDRGVQGTFTLEIGTWFRARKLVLQSANLNMSKERTTLGEPLYATVECELVPYRMVSYDEYLGWFLKAE